MTSQAIIVSRQFHKAFPKDCLVFTSKKDGGPEDAISEIDTAYSQKAYEDILCFYIWKFAVLIPATVCFIIYRALYELCNLLENISKHVEKKSIKLGQMDRQTLPWHNMTIFQTGVLKNTSLMPC